MRIAGPVHSAARWMRCLFSTFMAVLKPSPSTPPIRFSAGTRQPSKCTSPTGEPDWPIIR